MKDITVGSEVYDCLAFMAVEIFVFLILASYLDQVSKIYVRYSRLKPGLSYTVWS
jgi:hypothetical protein